MFKISPEGEALKSVLLLFLIKFWEHLPGFKHYVKHQLKSASKKI